jgi:hypothetical protein
MPAVHYPIGRRVLKRREKVPLLNFKKQFAPMVESGLMNPNDPNSKRQTIRARRKDGKNPKPGHTLYLYTGLRTKYTKKLGEAECKTSEPITIEENGDIIVGVKFLQWHDAKELSVRDGFKTYTDFMDFFKTVHGLPFYGFLITW